ncbi:hypothetical protein LCGC14_2364620, partial [marine sediment metagenome]
LDMRDIAIIDAFPVHDCQKTVLNVGCGEGRIDYWLAEMYYYKVYATDIKPYDTWNCGNKPTLPLFFSKSDIFDLSSFPIQSSPIVICSQVLEHLSGYKTALVHLLALTEVRLIITVPWRHSFNDSEHVNLWGDEAIDRFRNINEFVTLCHPYSTAISKIRTKPEDVEMGQWNYLIVVDKRQNK